MKLRTKGQGISLNVIIIAAIGLVVMVVLIAIFSGRMGSWIKGVEDCSGKDGICVSYNSEETTSGAACKERTDGRTVTLSSTDCRVSGSANDKATCCIPQ